MRAWLRTPTGPDGPLVSVTKALSLGHTVTRTVRRRGEVFVFGSGSLLERGNWLPKQGTGDHLGSYRQTIIPSYRVGRLMPEIFPGRSIYLGYIPQIYSGGWSAVVVSFSLPTSV